MARKIKSRRPSFFQNTTESIQKERSCAQSGCFEIGEYKAPKSPSNPKEYLWFCLPHVQEYNAKWNYYRDMTLDQVLQENIRDVTWRRPSRPFGEAVKKAQPKFHDFFGLFEEEKKVQQSKTLPPDVGKSLKGFQLKFPYTMIELKTRYRNFVKKYHPDVNRDNPKNEEILKEINVAFVILKTFLEDPTKKR